MSGQLALTMRRPKVPARDLTLADRARAWLVEHPTATNGEIAAVLGVRPSEVVRMLDDVGRP
jgi:hypothetical protein